MLPSSSRLLTNLAAIMAALLFGQMACAAGDAARGEMLADTCKGCHAIETYNNVYPTYHVPKVGGQNEGYLTSALKLYRDGLRVHPTMTAQAASLSDQEIEDIAAYMAVASGELAAGSAQGDMPAAGQVCAACHGLTGISPIPTNPNLAGQHENYMERALAEYRQGNRKGPNAIAMQAQLMAVSDEDLELIVAYYAEQEGLKSLPKDEDDL